MSRFVTERTTERVELDDGDWVEIVTRLTFGDRRAIEEKVFGIAGAAGAAPSGAGLLAGNIEAVIRAVVAWGGPGFCSLAEHPHAGDCTPQPITAANIERLDETGERILLEIRQRQVARTKGFTPAPTSSTAEAAPAVRPAVASSSSRSSSALAGPGTSS